MVAFARSIVATAPVRPSIWSWRRALAFLMLGSVAGWALILGAVVALFD